MPQRGARVRQTVARVHKRRAAGVRPLEPVLSWATPRKFPNRSRAHRSNRFLRWVQPRSDCRRRPFVRHETGLALAAAILPPATTSLMVPRSRAGSAWRGARGGGIEMQRLAAALPGHIVTTPHSTIFNDLQTLPHRTRSSPSSSSLLPSTIEIRNFFRGQVETVGQALPIPANLPRDLSALCAGFWCAQLAATGQVIRVSPSPHRARANHDNPGRQYSLCLERRQRACR